MCVVFGCVVCGARPLDPECGPAGASSKCAAAGFEQRPFLNKSSGGLKAVHVVHVVHCSSAAMRRCGSRPCSPAGAHARQAPVHALASALQVYPRRQIKRPRGRIPHLSYMRWFMRRKRDLSYMRWFMRRKRGNQSVLSRGVGGVTTRQA